MTMVKKRDYSVDLSIIITAHNEGILIHKTIASVRRAVTKLEGRFTYEIILHIDKPNQATSEYVKIHKNTSLKDVRIYDNNFGDLGLSRNFAVTKAYGKFVSFIDADDLMSQNWLIDAYDFLSKHEYGKYVAHTAMTVEFGDVNSIIQKYGEINKTTDTLLNVYSARWNSVIIAPRTVLLKYPYPTNNPGYGYEDWFLSCSFIQNNIHNTLIPETVIFVRRKVAGSEWARQKNSRSVLHAHPLLSFKNFRELNLKNTVESNVISKVTPIQKFKKMILPIVATSPKAKALFSKVYYRARGYYNKIRSYNPNSDNSSLPPKWLIDEWRLIHSIEKELFPTQQLVNNSEIYHTISPDHYIVGRAYKALADLTRYDIYDYIIFVPWLIKGGADMFAINYANEIAEVSGKNVLVIATNTGLASIWQSKLTGSVDFMPFGEIAGQLPIDHQYRLLEQIIENSGAKILHILNSVLGYDFLLSHQTYLEGSQKKIVVTSFSQSIDDTGRIFGFSHTHVPKVYDIADIITTDNQSISNMWQSEYGFDYKKIVIHHQPITLHKEISRENHHNNGTIKVLWAARLAPEKQPDLVGVIGEALLDNPKITIEMYGEVDKGFDTSFLESLPSNVSYKGPFNDFFALPLEDYDAYLYTTLFDGMPNTILEAAQAKLPIISSAIGGIPEFITDKETGILITDIRNPKSYADAIRLLVNSHNLSIKLGQNAYEKIKKDFSVDKYREQIKEMLSKLND
jgi:glycosyltransferase involved in cell wall biosynthesis